MCEVRSSLCSQPASTSWVSRPVTVTVSRHLPIKAAHFLPSPPLSLLSGRAMTAPRLLIGPFPRQRPGMVDFITWHASMWLLLFHLWSVLRPTASLQLWSLFFTFLLLFFSHRSEDSARKWDQKAIYRARKHSKGRTALSAHLCLSATMEVRLIYLGIERQRPLVMCVLSWGKAGVELQICESLSQSFSRNKQ